MVLGIRTCLPVSRLSISRASLCAWLKQTKMEAFGAEKGLLQD